MMAVILGGSGSGKSAYAEDVTLKLAGGMQKYYLATMQVFGEEGEKKVERHRKLRSGKGFLTVEQPVNILEAVTKMEPGEKTVLLECMSNLAANEMFGESDADGGEPDAKCGGSGAEAADFRTPEAVSSRILEQIRGLRAQVTHLVIVTNNVSEDGILYDEGTMNYLKALGSINQGLAAMADTVTEVVVGIPVLVKGRIE